MGIPYFRPGLLGQAKPQGTLVEVRGEEAGRSECRPVMGRIRVEEQSGITRPEREQTSYAGAPLQENQENLLQEGKQMTAIFGSAGAPSTYGWGLLTSNAKSVHV